MPGPYGFTEQKNSMEMVRHHHKCIQSNIRKMNRNTVPTGRNNVRSRVAYHLPIYNLAKDALAVARADSNEVRPRLGIVESWEPQLLPQS